MRDRERVGGRCPPAVGSGAGDAGPRRADPRLARPRRSDQDRGGRGPFLFLTETKSYKLPTPPAMHNKGNYVVSIGEVARWMAAQAEALGVEIYPASRHPRCCSTRTGRSRASPPAIWIGKDGERTDNYTPGMELHARQTLLAEGCRGSLTKGLFERFDLRRECDPQTYSIGIKELWEIDPSRHRPGLIVHTIGWPMDRGTYGGSWMYHAADNQVSIGFVIGLDYQNPYLSPSTSSSVSRPIRRSASTWKAGASATVQGRCRRAGSSRSPGSPFREAALSATPRASSTCQDQGQPYRHEERHGLRRSGIRAPRL